MKNLIINLIEDESGATLTEYAIIGAIIATHLIILATIASVGVAAVMYIFGN